jgi:peptidoglycan-N-acetylglucosamine deacetylase
MTTPISPLWPLQRACAVTLAYDDGLAAHALELAPALADLGVPVTFFAPVESDLIRNPDRWTRAAELGHELGNHTIFHPCRKAGPEDRSWVEPCFDLAEYTESRLRRELMVANGVLGMIDGRSERSYGNTCCETTIGPASAPSSMTGVLRTLFIAARGTMKDSPAQPGPAFDPFDVGTNSMDGRSFEQLQRIVETARMTRGWVVLTAHGVGPAEHELNVDVQTHWRFIRWLRDQADVWVAPFIDAAKSACEQSARACGCQAAAP